MVLFTQFINSGLKRTSTVIVELLCQIAKENYLTRFCAFKKLPNKYVISQA